MNNPRSTVIHTPMSTSEFRDALATLGMSQRSFARLTGQHLRTVQHHALGTAPVPGPVAVLLHFALANPVAARAFGLGPNRLAGADQDGPAP